MYYASYNIPVKEGPTMAAVVKVRKVGNSLGVILTKDVIESLGVAEGDELFAVRSHEGIRLTPYDPDFAKALESTRDYMRRHRDALHELSKR
jgi:putative addiction module antidote